MQNLGSIDVYDPTYIEFIKKNGFVSDFGDLAERAFKMGISVLCIHLDADDTSDTTVFENKITPAFQKTELTDKQICNNLVAVVPITMSEAWMLADINLLKEEIGTTLSNTDLGLNRNPETIADPKEVIINALRIAQNDIPKRRKRITISDIYQPVGQSISLLELERLASFQKFRNAVKNAFIKLNYLHVS